MEGMLCPFDLEKSFVRAELDCDVHTRLPDGCCARSGTVVPLDRALHGVKRLSRS